MHFFEKYANNFSVAEVIVSSASLTQSYINAVSKTGSQVDLVFILLTSEIKYGIWKQQPAVEALSTVLFQPALTFSTNGRPVFAVGELRFALFASSENKKKKEKALLISYLRN